MVSYAICDGSRPHHEESTRETRILGGEKMVGDLSLTPKTRTGSGVIVV